MADQSRGSERRNVATAQALLAISGALIAFLGGTLGLAGTLMADRSSYCALAGVGLILAGALIARSRREGAWVFIGVVAITLIWSLRNGSTGGTSLVVRLIGPALLLGMMALLMPSLRGWRVRRTILTFVVVLFLSVGFGIGVVTGGPFAAPTAAAPDSLDIQHGSN